jgi:nitrogen fixation NifU-like protein
MYREHILDHGMNPRHWGLLDPCDVDHEEHNITCGDRLRITLRIDHDGIIREVGWDGEGCAISQASASMLGEVILGKSVAEVGQITRDQIVAMLGIPLGINRLKCALLSLKTLIVGVAGEQHDEADEEADDNGTQERR